MNRHQLSVGCAIAGLSLFLASPVVLAEAKVIGGSDSVVFDTATDAPGMQLRVTGPGGFLREALFVQGEPIELPISKSVGWPDGTYNFELWPVRGMTVRTSDRFAPGTDDGATAAASGSFRVVDGAVIAPDADIVEHGIAQAKLVDQDGGHGTNDQVIPDDLIVQGSGCFGFDCVNNENFGFDTIRMKENNTRIKFEDTSVGAFPSTDWQLTANDSASGGLNKFSIEDVTAASVPFTIEGGATTNSLYVDSTGRVGLRTSTPVLDLHITTSNTPGIRLEQTNAGGFTAQTWDIAANEANFFVRDVTGGSLLPFRIRPGAPTSSIDIANDGEVGMGTASPDASLHVRRVSGPTSTVQLHIEDASTTAVDRPMLRLTNNGGSEIFFENSATTNTWKFKSRGSDEAFLMNFTANAGQELTLSTNGNLTIGGTLTELSDRNAKSAIIALQPAAVLAALEQVAVSEWSYSNDASGARHVGPMAQDFHAAFGLGEDERHISPRDMAGVALASSQALLSMIRERDVEIAALKAQVEALVQRLDARGE